MDALATLGDSLRTESEKLKALDSAYAGPTNLAEAETMVGMLKPVMDAGADAYVTARGENMDPGIAAMQKTLGEVGDLMSRAEAEERTILAQITEAERRKEEEQVLRENLTRKQKDLRALIKLLEGKGVLLSDLDTRLNTADPSRVAAGATETECAETVRKIGESVVAIQNLMDLDISKLDQTSTPNLKDLRVELTARLRDTKRALRICDRVISDAEVALLAAETRARARARTRTPGVIDQLEREVEAAGGNVSSAQENTIRQALDGEISRMSAEARSMNRDTSDGVIRALRRSARRVIQIAERLGIKRQKFEAQNVEAILQGILNEKKERAAKAAREAAARAGAGGTEGTGGEAAAGAGEGAGTEDEDDTGDGAATGEAAAGAGETGPSHAELMAANFERYGISQDAINSIPDYANLSEGQQIMALQNLGQLVLKRVEQEAIQDYKSEYKQAGFFRGFFKRIRMRMWRGDFMDQYRRARATRFKRDGAMNTNFLQNLVHKFNNRGPEVTRETSGGQNILKVHWFSERLITPEFEAANPGTLAALRNFNQVADHFAQVPASWRRDGTNDQAGWYKTYSERYIRARDALISKLDPQGIGLNQRLLDKVFEAGELVEENQTFTAHTGNADKEFIRLLGRN